MSDDSAVPSWLDFFSEDFDPVAALQHDSLEPPEKNVQPYESLNEYEEEMSKYSKKKSPKKEQQKEVCNTESEVELPKLSCKRNIGYVTMKRKERANVFVRMEGKLYTLNIRLFLRNPILYLPTRLEKWTTWNYA